MGHYLLLKATLKYVDYFKRSKGTERGSDFILYMMCHQRHKKIIIFNYYVRLDVFNQLFPASPPAWMSVIAVKNSISSYSIIKVFFHAKFHRNRCGSLIIKSCQTDKQSYFWVCNVYMYLKTIVNNQNVLLREYIDKGMVKCLKIIVNLDISKHTWDISVLQLSCTFYEPKPKLNRFNKKKHTKISKIADILTNQKSGDSNDIMIEYTRSPNRLRTWYGCVRDYTHKSLRLYESGTLTWECNNLHVNALILINDEQIQLS